MRKQERTNGRIQLNIRKTANIENPEEVKEYKAEYVEKTIPGKKTIHPLTVDYISVFRERITYAKSQQKNINITFLEATMAYGKAWLEAIMYVPHKEGQNDKEWKISKQIQ